MCTGLEIAALVGTVATAATQVDAGNRRQDQLDDEATYERDAAQQQAEQFSRARRKQVAAARAATAGSGTALDSFSEINTSDIERLGSSDEEMTLLTGERRARSLNYSGEQAATSAKSQALAGLLTTGYQAGWKGRKG